MTPLLTPTPAPAAPKTPSTPPHAGPHRHWPFWTVIVLLLVVIGVESFFFWNQIRINQKIAAESEKSLALFEKSGKLTARGNQTQVLLKNTQFIWSPHVFIKTPELSATVIPLHGNVVDFDNLSDFIVRVNQGNVYIRPDVLQGMFNESVFNYPNSKLRDLKVTIVQNNGENFVNLDGSLNFIFWIPFQMQTKLSIDHKTNTLVISVSRLKVFGLIPITKLIDFSPFHLEKMIALPENHHLSIHDNLIMVKPFGLFPYPKLDGAMSHIVVNPNLIELSFGGQNPGSITINHLPAPSASAYIYVQGGNTQFGQLGMMNSRIQVLSKSGSTIFPFSLSHYFAKLPASSIEVQTDNTVVVKMPNE